MEANKRAYIVFGAGGEIGGATAHRLAAASNFVIGTLRNNQMRSKVSELAHDGVVPEGIDDVADRDLMIRRASVMPNDSDGIIYAVGHCPPDGFPEAIRYPLSQLPIDNYLKEIEMHQIGALNVFQIFLKNVKDGGCFLFISSAITRLKGQFPPFLQCYHYASAISAEDWLIEGMRNDPAVIERNIKIHRIAPAAVDTPFHRPGPKPPRLIPMSEVVEEIVAALQSETHVDKMIL